MSEIVDELLNRDEDFRRIAHGSFLPSVHKRAADTIIALRAALDRAEAAVVDAERGKWIKCYHKSTDHDDLNNHTPYTLQAWRSDGYLIILQPCRHGLYVLRTPDGQGQVASHLLSECQNAAAQHRAAIRAQAPQ